MADMGRIRHGIMDHGQIAVDLSHRTGVIVVGMLDVVGAYREKKLLNAL
jgi:hypothetical protein